MPKYAAPEFRAMGEKCRDARDPGNICRSCDLDGTTLQERVIGMLIAIMLDNLRAGGLGRSAIRATKRAAAHDTDVTLQPAREGIRGLDKEFEACSQGRCPR